MQNFIQSICMDNQAQEMLWRKRITHPCCKHWYAIWVSIGVLKVGYGFLPVNERKQMQMTQVLGVLKSCKRHSWNSIFSSSTKACPGYCDYLGNGPADETPLSSCSGRDSSTEISKIMHGWVWEEVTKHGRQSIETPENHDKAKL